MSPVCAKAQRAHWGQPADRRAPGSALRQRSDEGQEPFLPLAILTDFSAARGDSELIFFFFPMSWSLTPKTRQDKQYLLCSNKWLGSIWLVITHPLFQRKEVSCKKNSFYTSGREQSLYTEEQVMLTLIVATSEC